MLADKRRGRRNGKTRFFEQIARFRERVVIVAVSVYGQRDGARAVPRKPPQKGTSSGGTLPPYTGAPNMRTSSSPNAYPLMRAASGVISAMRVSHSILSKKTFPTALTIFFVACVGLKYMSVSRISSPIFGFRKYSITKKTFCKAQTQKASV